MLKIPEAKENDRSIPTSFEKKFVSSKNQKIVNVLMWVLTVFMFGSALVFFPSMASGGMFLFACISIPLEKIQIFFRTKGIKGWVKAIILIILFVICINLYKIR